MIKNRCLTVLFYLSLLKHADFLALKAWFKAGIFILNYIASKRVDEKSEINLSYGVAMN